MAGSRDELAREVGDQALRILAEVERLPPREQLPYLKGPAMEGLPADIRVAVESLVLRGVNLSADDAKAGHRRFVAAVALLMAALPVIALAIWGERVGVFAFGATLIAGLLALVFTRDELTADQARLVRTVSAFAAGTAMALVPGFLELTWTGGDLAIRAGGALAAFVLVYCWAPGK